MNLTRIESFRQHYLTKKLKSPDLYRSGDHAVDVILPNDLLEYANAASGHSGFGSGARARGIRRECRNATQFLSEIFASTDSLVKFLNSSEKNAEAYIATVRERHLGQQQPKEIMANDPEEGVWALLGKDGVAQLRAKTKDKAQLIQDFNCMTLKAFEERYILVDSLAV